MITHARRFIGQMEGQSALMCERMGRWPCDKCHQHRIITVTTLVPVSKGNARPRISKERDPQLTLCWDCILKAMLRTLFSWARK